MDEFPPDWTKIKAKYESLIESLQETAEMATVDKEIAEEKYDSCQKELEEARAKLAELSNQTNQETDVVGNKGAAVYQLQKVEEQNELLKQALVKIRDISERDKKALEELQEHYELLQERCIELEDKEQKLIIQNKIYSEQIDCHDAAREMIEKLNEEKTCLEDKVKELSDELEDMEKLNDVNERIIESAKENEVELQSELDRMKCQLAELLKSKLDLEDYLSNQEHSLSKLKEKNQTLQNELMASRVNQEPSDNVEIQKHEMESVAHKLNFLESKLGDKEAEIVRHKRNLLSMEEQMTSLSQLTKVQATQIDELKHNYESKLSDINELKRLLKKKMEHISELEIRREMVEKKLQNLQQDSETKMFNLSRELEKMIGKEVKYEDALKRQEEHIDNLESERRELREQLSRSNINFDRSTAATNVSMVTAQEMSFANASLKFHNPMEFQPIKHSSSQLDEFSLEERLRNLEHTFEIMKNKNHNLELKLAAKELNDKLPILSLNSFSSSREDEDLTSIKELSTRASKLKRETRLAMINESIPKNSRNVESHNRRDQFEAYKLAFKYQKIENDAYKLWSDSQLINQESLFPKMREQEYQSTPVK